jgi:hypothetical protein
MQTIMDALTIIANGLTSKDRAHYAGLLGPRTRGSTSKKGIESLPLDTALTQFQPAQAVPRCSYYRFALPKNFEPRVRAVPLRDFKGEYAIVLGAHGPELLATKHGPGSGSDHATMIQGPDGDIWTWFPGDPLPSFSDRIIRSPEGLSFSWTQEGEIIKDITDEVKSLCYGRMLAFPDIAVKL